MFTREVRFYQALADKWVKFLHTDVTMRVFRINLRTHPYFSKCLGAKSAVRSLAPISFPKQIQRLVSSYSPNVWRVPLIAHNLHIPLLIRCGYQWSRFKKPLVKRTVVHLIEHMAYHAAFGLFLPRRCHASSRVTKSPNENLPISNTLIQTLSTDRDTNRKHRL